METLVNDIAIVAARFLGRDDIADFMELAKDQDSPEPSADAKLLATSVGITCQELAEEHFPLESSETVSSDENCKIWLSDFESKPNRVLAVVDENGNNETFRNFDGFVKVSKPSYAYTVYFEKIPSIPDINDNAEHSANVTTRVLAYGTCCHFCLCSLLFDEAKLWDARFHDAIAEIRMKNDRKKRVKRRWKV